MGGSRRNFMEIEVNRKLAQRVGQEHVIFSKNSIIT